MPNDIAEIAKLTNLGMAPIAAQQIWFALSPEEQDSIRETTDAAEIRAVLDAHADATAAQKATDVVTDARPESG